MLNDRLRRSAAGPTTWRKGEDATLGWLRMLQLFGTCSNQVVIWNLHYGSRAAHVSGAANGSFGASAQPIGITQAAQATLSKRAFASFRSAVSKPSVNQP